MVNLGQVGIGSWGQNLLRSYSGLKDCAVRICCDINTAALAKVKSYYNDRIRVTDSIDEFLKEPGLDAVVIATSPASHARLAVEALSKGKHVFVEKPLALNLRDAERMIRAAKENKRILMVGHLLLYHPAVKKLKELIKRGVLGEIYYMYSTRVNLGQVREQENALWSLTAHDVSVAMYLLDKRPYQVQATGKGYIRPPIQDMVFVTLNFRNNILAHIHASWLDPHKIRKFTIVGSRRMVVFDDMESNEKFRIYDKGFDWQKTSSYESFLTLREGDISIPRIDMIEPLKLECQHFINCIIHNRRPLTDGENGREVLKVLAAAQRSLNSNGRVIEI